MRMNILLLLAYNRAKVNRVPENKQGPEGPCKRDYSLPFDDKVVKPRRGLVLKQPSGIAFR